MTNNSSENADGKDVKRKSVAREYAEAIFIAPVSYTHLTLPTIYSV